MIIKSENDFVRTFDMDSKFLKTLLVLTTVFLIFAGPTYISFLLSEVFQLNYLASVVIGFSLFLVGLFLIYFLVRKRLLHS